jgi:NADPH2:quinone reductase
MAETSQAKAQTMRAVAQDKFGGPETLQIKNLPVPEVGPGEVLVRVEVAGVGAWDPFEREGGFVEIMGTSPTFRMCLVPKGPARLPR